MRSEIIKDLFLDALWELFYWPYWWYSRGLKKTALFTWHKVRDGFKGLAFGIMFKSFFKPMYGQRDVVSYVLSVIFRVVHLFLRSILLLIWFSFWLIVFVVYVFLPIVLIIKLITG